jgi:hypothetical protein
MRRHERLGIEAAAGGAVGDQRDAHRRRVLSRAVFGRIDHIGVAVADLEAAVDPPPAHLRHAVVHRETWLAQGVEAVLLDVGESHVELLRPLGEDTPVGRFLAEARARPAPRRLPGGRHRGDAGPAARARACA